MPNEEWTESDLDLRSPQEYEGIGVKIDLPFYQPIR